HKTVSVLAHRREIITQTSKKLAENKIRHGIIQAGFSPRPMERVQVASIDALRMRCIRHKIMLLPAADLLVIDEAHHTPATTYCKIIDAYPDAVLHGATSTPCSGGGLGVCCILMQMSESN